MAIPTADKLIEELRSHQLLSPAQLAELEELPDRPSDSRELAKEIVQRQWLTRFQVNTVYQGRAKELFLGPYVLLDRLGEGGMGEVYRARHQRLERIVALKVVRTEKIKSKEGLDRFLREAVAAAQLSHPNIVTLYEEQQVGDIHFLAMEYIKGVDLARWVREKGPMPIAHACTFIRQAALGLDHAHKRGLVHRDIKPSNLMLVAGTNQVKLLDMGLARLDREGDGEAEGALTQEGAVMGTPDFLAPEQALNAHTADIRADIYSLGCTFYFLLTGRAPFPGGALSEKLLKHQLHEPTPVRELRPETPEAVTAVLAKMMAKKPQDRYQTPAALAAALAPLCRPGAVPATRQTVKPAAPPQTDSETDSLSGEVTVSPDEGVDVELVTNLRNASPTQVPTPSRRKSGPRAVPTQAQAPRGRSHWLGWVAGAAAGVVALVAAGALVVLFLNFLGGDKPGEPAPPVQQPRPKVLTLDDLQAAVPADEQFGWQPRGLVAVLGTHKWRHWAAVKGLTFRKDTGELVSFGDDDQVRLCDPRTGAERLAIPTQTRGPLYPNRPLACSADGVYVAAMVDYKVTVYLTSTGREEATVPGTIMAFAPDTNLLAVVSGPRVDLYTVPFKSAAPAPVAMLPVNAPVTALAFAPKGGVLATASPPLPVKGKKEPGGEIKLWDLTTRQPTVKIPTDNHSTRVLVFSADGATLATGAQFAQAGKFPVVLWDVAGAKEKARLEIHKGPISGLAMTADMQRLISASQDGTVRLWSLQTQRELGVPLHDQGEREAVFGLALAPDSRLLAVGCRDGAIRLYDLASGKEREDSARAYESWIRAAAVAHDRTRLAVGLQDKSLHIVDAATLKEQPPLKGHNWPAVALTFSRDDKLLFSASLDKTLGVWDVAKNAELQPVAFFHPVYALDLSPEGQQLASGSYAPFIRIVDPATRKELANLSGHTGAVVGLDYFHDARNPRLASVALDGSLRVWDTGKGKELFSVIGAHPTILTVQPPWPPLTDFDVHAVAVSPKGKVIVTAGTDGAVKVWDVAAAKALYGLKEQLSAALAGMFPRDAASVTSWKNAQLKGPVPAPYRSLAFSPDGKLLAVGCERGGLTLYDTTTWKAAEQWKLPGAVHKLRFDTAGRHLVSVHGNGTAYVLRLGAK